MFRKILGTAILATGLMAATVTSAHAERSPGVDETFVIDVCPFPIEVHASNTISHFIDNHDGTTTQTVDGVWIAAGPLHTVYFGHWSRISLDGDFFGIPVVGNGQSVDFCERLS